MLNWIKRKLGITALVDAKASMESELRLLHSRIRLLEADNRNLKDKLAYDSEVNIDLNIKGPSRIIFIGDRRNNDPIVRSYTVDVKDFRHLLDQLEERHGYFRLGRVEAAKPFEAEIKECYNARTSYIRWILYLS